MVVCEFSDGLSPKCRAILQAAAEVFLEVGFGAASMDAIAKRANVSKQTIYKLIAYFKAWHTAYDLWLL